MVEPLTDDPRRFGALERLWVHEGRSSRCARVERWRLQRDGRVVLWLDVARDRSAAEGLVGARLEVSAEDAVRPGTDCYFVHDLVGLEVVTEDGESCGRVKGVMPTAGGDLLEIAGPGGEILLPAVRSMIRRVDLEHGCMLVELPDGLRELNQDG
jgi:16S rRNA processing protein RimM